MRLIELCAGTAAVSLAALGAPEFPVSRFGSKRGYADAILRRMGLARGGLLEHASELVLVEADPRVAGVLKALLTEPGKLYEGLLEVRRGGHHLTERQLWQRVRWEPGPAKSLVWMAGARGGIGRWRGDHKLRPQSGGFSPNLDELQRRVAEFARWVRERGWVVEVKVVCEDLWKVSSSRYSPSLVYFDPPYPGETQYRHRLEREPGHIALGWHESGHHVFMSYDRPITERTRGMRCEEITGERVGQARTNPTPEWLIEFPEAI